MRADKLTKLVKLITIIATAVVVLLVGIIVGEYIKIASLNHQIDDITSEINSMTERKSELETDMEHHSSSTYIEDYARRKLRMLDEGENYIIFE